MTIRRGRTLVLLMFFITGCGEIPGISENRKNFAPWEKLPEGNGITYVETFTQDPGIDRIYLAKMAFEDEAALQTVINTFGLVPHDNEDDVESFAGVFKDNQPEWFPLRDVTDVYVFPSQYGQEYVANLWVDANNKVMILERTWW